MAMKLFVVLALVSFTGCQSYVLRSDEPKQQLEQVKDAFWGYFFEASETAINGLKTMEASKLAQQVSDKIGESVEAARHYRDIVGKQLITISEELHKTISERVEQLSESLKPDVNELRAQLEPLTAKLEADIQQQVQKVRQVLDPYTESLDTESLRDTAREIYWKLVRSAESSLPEVWDKLGHSNEKLMKRVKENLVEIRRSFDPLIQLPMREVYGDFLILEKILEPFIEDLKVGLDLSAQVLESKLTALWESSPKIA